MPSTNNSNNNNLSTPLIGHLPQHESESDEEQGYMQCSSLMLAMVYADDEESYQKKVDDGCQWFNNFVILVVLPALLFLQFGISFTAQDTTGLEWSVVNSAIVMFVITAALYRQVVQDFKISCSVTVLLLPEILMNAVLGLVLCGQVVPAFALLLISSMLCLFVFVVASSIRVLAVEKQCDEESVHDELVEGFEPVWSL